MEKVSGLTYQDFEKYGLHVIEGRSIQGTLSYERPLFLFGPRRIKNCSIGAFTLLNGYQSASIYSTKIGRYCSLAEDTVIGPPEHPTDWLSSSVFAFARPRFSPLLYRSAEFARLAPDASVPGYFGTPGKTEIGHDAYIGAGAFVKRDVKIGHGAVVAGAAVVVKDVPAYSIVAGVPAKLVRMRFPEKLVERLLKLEWWLYDLAPHKTLVDFSKVEATVGYLEDALAAGKLDVLKPETYRISQPEHVRASGVEGTYDLERLDQPLY